MKQTIKKIIVSLTLSICIWLAMHFVVYGSTYSSLVMLLGLNIMENKLIVESGLLLFSGALFVNIYQLIRNRFFCPFVRAEGIIYFVLLFGIIMLKSRGTQAVNMDIFDLYRSIIEYPASVLINLLLFVPVGAVIFRYSKTVFKAFVISFVLIVAIEISQYLLSLGICDIVDFVVNMAGSAIGILVLSILRDSGYCVVHEDKYCVNIMRCQNHES